MIDLPAEFLQRMRGTLGEEEFGRFRQSYDLPPAKGLRVNGLKGLKLADAELLRAKFGLQPVSWCQDGFYYQAQTKPGAHPYHQAGLYYLQDPAAMAVVEALRVNLCDKVLDLCAAPGGKSTQVAAKLQNSGLLVANEICVSRAKVLRENLQRMGVRNAVVLSSEPQKLTQRFASFFDKVIVDAPCSGEGLFRKNPEAVGQWSKAKVLGCAKRQHNILQEAAKMVAPGGSLVYSTCTFAPVENQRQVERFLREHPDFAPLPVDSLDCFGEFSSYQIWPHRHQGEGHFLAVLHKTLSSSDKTKSYKARRKRSKRSKRVPLWEDFAQKFLREELAGEVRHLNDNLYLVNFPIEFELAGLNALSMGLHLGKQSKGRFEPSHALALALKSSAFCNCLNLGCDDPLLGEYLAGESLRVDLPSGWCLVAVDGFGLGWGKVAGGRLNNYLPKGLRRR